MPKLPSAATLAFEYGVPYSELPLIPIVFTHPDSPSVLVLCLVDSGASGVMLPSELADALDLRLEIPSGPIVGVTGVTEGWVHPLTATVPDLDDFTFPVDAVFLPLLPVALIGRSPFFRSLVVAFQQEQGILYFNFG